MIVVHSPRKNRQKTPQQSPEKNDLPSRRTKPLVPPFFAPKNLAAQQLPDSSIPSSSPAFGTPAHPLRPFTVTAPAKAAILPILLPPATLRPLAFRTFTKKHSLTLTSSALQELATFIGRHCGSGWREEGLAEKVLEEVAKSWKNRNGGVIVEGNSPELKDILKTLEGNMSGGKIISGARGLARQNSLLLEPTQDPDYSKTRLGLRPSAALTRDDSQTGIGMSGLEVQDEPDDEELSDPRSWLKVIDAYSQPQLTYNTKTKHFERESRKPSLLPPASHKTTLFRNRYNVIHQRLLRQDSFQTSAVHEARTASLSRSSSSNLQQSHKITSIANLLGRHGSYRMLLGMLVVLPEGNLAISDLTGTIALDLSQAVAIPADSAWFTPGMMVLVDGVYEEEEETLGKGLSGSSGVGGTIGGRFQGFFIGQPPCETRHTTLGVGGDAGEHATTGGGFGWIDFLGVGSERAVGGRMRKLEHRLIRQPHLSSPSNPDDLPSSRGRARVVVIGELNLDNPRSLQVLRKILTLYAAEPEGATPMSFVVTGNFSSRAVMASRGSGNNSIEYKEYFDALASALADFPSLLTTATFVFVPGDNDGWASAFGGGAAVPLPRKGVPDLFTSRVRRVFAAANAEAGLTNKEGEDRRGGEAVWTTNPARLSLFGPAHEIVLFRDDISSRLRRTAVRLKQQHPKPQPEAAGGDDTAMSGALAAGDDDVMEVDIDTQEPPTAEPEKEPGPAAVPHDVLSARKLVKTVLDQGFLAPFRQAVRPVHWDLSSALHLYPLPTAMVLVDAETPPFVVKYEGCLVMNPGPVLVPGRRGLGRWIEYEIGRTGRVRECLV